ncbi:MAG: DMT family transporter [Beijerinckiaceae bacterium]
MNSHSAQADSRANDRRQALAIAALLASVAIWGLQFAMVRIAVTTSVTALDVTLLRYIFAFPIMLPLAWMYIARVGSAIDWKRALIVGSIGGAPVFLVSNFGLQFAPASHASCLQPGTVAVVATSYLLATSGARRTPLMPLGLAVAVAGLAFVALGGAGGAGVGPLTPLGDALFVVSGIFWAAYTILMARWKMPPALMTALSAVLSLLVTPLFIPFMESRLASASWREIILHGAFQGIVSYAIAFLLWSYAAKILGPVRAGFSAPLIPAFGVLIAIPVLGEWPQPLQWVGVAGVALGLLTIALAQLGPRQSASPFTKS